MNVRIAALETATVTLPVNRRLVVRGSRGTHDYSSFVLVRVVTSADVAGYGEVSATPLWSGEDAETATHMIRDVLRPILVGEPLAPVARLTGLMDRALAANPFTKAGVNTALWDALGRTLGLPVAALLGGPFREAVPIKWSLSGDGEALETAYAAALEIGLRAFKVKVGLGVDGDVARFALARRLVGEDTFLGADANGGWSRLEAARAIHGLASLGAAFVEQPVAPSDLDGHRELRRAGLPVVLDESVYSPDDLVCAIRADAADAVAVYVGKSGGLERAVLTARVAQLFGLDVLVGSNGEMGVGAAAQIHVACACERLGAIPSDIIGRLFYEEDTLAAPLPIDGVEARLPDGAGLGVEPSAEIAGRFA